MNLKNGQKFSQKKGNNNRRMFEISEREKKMSKSKGTYNRKFSFL